MNEEKELNTIDKEAEKKAKKKARKLRNKLRRIEKKISQIKEMTFITFG
ncbi:MAG: hypothetical protein QNJ54_24455 [Prochloraceae cyanobacterium]|nr:hypothetical protein [Prochloraceae cyanobacterium]